MLGAPRRAEDRLSVCCGRDRCTHQYVHAPSFLWPSTRIACIERSRLVWAAGAHRGCWETRRRRGLPEALAIALIRESPAVRGRVLQRPAAVPGRGSRTRAGPAKRVHSRRTRRVCDRTAPRFATPLAPCSCTRHESPARVGTTASTQGVCAGQCSNTTALRARRGLVVSHAPRGHAETRSLQQRVRYRVHGLTRTLHAWFGRPNP